MKRLTKLGLRKNARKGSNWAQAVHEHLNQRGDPADPKPTAVYRHRHLIPWNTLLKEIRRTPKASRSGKDFAV